MARTQKEKVKVAEDEGEDETSPESADYDGNVESVSSAAEIREGERGRTVSPSKMQVNLLEKTRIWRIHQLKEDQCAILEKYLKVMSVLPGKLYWYDKLGDIPSRKPKMIEDLPCECKLQEEYKISENIEEGCKSEEEKPTKQESSAGKSGNSINPFNPGSPEMTIEFHGKLVVKTTEVKYPLQHLVQHNSTCNASRISQHFSCIAEYFIDEEVDPDIFLYTLFPNDKKELEVYKILYENRKVLRERLKDGIGRKHEIGEGGMNEDEFELWWAGRQNRITKYNALRNLLLELMKPYEKYLSSGTNSDDETDDPNQKRLQAEDSEIYIEEPIDYATYGAALYLDCQIEPEENKPSTSEG